MTSAPNYFDRLFKSMSYGLFGNVNPGHINWVRAQFSAPSIEKAYQQYLVELELPKDRIINYVGVFIYLVFGFLDLITFTDNLALVLILRLMICAPIAIGLIGLTFVDKFKPHFQNITIAVMAIGTGSIVIMIGLMDPESGSAYIIGILAIFIFFACIQRLHFPTAAAVYASTIAAYSLTVIFISPKSSHEIISGHFFMIFIGSVATVTTYIQEVRSRLDFYRRRQREKDAGYIKELLIEATAADRAKINFLSILSHELRTPLHQIVGFSEVVVNQIANEPKSDPTAHLKEIQSAAARLLTSIGKMLRYADATAGKISYDPGNCSVQYLTETIIDQMRTKAEKAKVTIEWRDLEQATLNIDHLHTAYAVCQLIDNAIAASPAGSTIILRGECNEDGYYALAIKDQGGGMTAEQIDAAFQPFTQAEDVKTRSMEGAGLGLSLSKKILEDQGAELILHSEPGVGTKVLMRLPLAKDQKTAAEARD